MFITTFKHCVDNALKTECVSVNVTVLCTLALSENDKLSWYMTLDDRFRQPHFHRCRTWYSGWGIYWQFPYRTGTRAKCPDSCFNNPLIFLTISFFFHFSRNSEQQSYGVSGSLHENLHMAFLYIFS